VFLFSFDVLPGFGLALDHWSPDHHGPNVYDPSELRSDVNGKVVRYLHEEGTEIAKGDTFVVPGAVR
jgi:acetyl/propionyl-CoA carboxylase alpha subunit